MKFALTENVETDWVHAILRTGSVTFMIAYAAAMIWLRISPTEMAQGFILLGLTSFSFVASFFLFVRSSPKGKRWRHWLPMAHDYTALTVAMVHGGEPFMVFCAFGICAIAGHGLRYGKRALWGAAAMSMSSISVTTLYSNYWHKNLFVVATWIALSLTLPFYMHLLIGKLQAAYQAEHEANLSKSRFLAQASHDLRQPIHAISLFTACLRDGGLGRRELELVDNIDRSLQGVSRLFKSLLDVSTLESGKVIPRADVFPIMDLMQDVARQNSEAAQRSGGVVQVMPCSAYVCTDRTLLTTMLQNVVNNAVKYAPGREILVGCRHGGDHLAVQVYDRGTGIPGEHLSRVFDEFYQVRQRGDKDVEGVGLGLPIVRRIGALLGVTVDLKSVVGKGTCVTLSGLKIAPPPRTELATPVIGQGGGLSGLRVLLVEDDEAVLSATASLLRRWGCEVQAERAIPSAPDACDLLITDFDLGEGQTGSDCIQQVRACMSHPVPAVVMSGHEEGKVREDLGDLDVPILPKPVRPMELRNVIAAAQLEMRPV